MNRPWMPLYIADFLADTAHLDAEETGVYLLLIMHYWQKGALPAEDAKLARIGRVSLKKWSSLRETISQFFSAEWKHARIESELSKATDISEKRREAARQKASKQSANAEQLQSNSRHTRVRSQSQSHTQSDTNVSDNSASRTVPVAETPRQRLWAEGLPALVALGVSEKQARPLVGKWLKAAGDDCERVLSLIADAGRKSPVDPVGWITASFAARASPSRNGIVELFNELTGGMDDGSGFGGIPGRGGGPVPDEGSIGPARVLSLTAREVR